MSLVDYRQVLLKVSFKGVVFMLKRWNTFSKMVVLIVLLILSVVIIYSYTNHVSVSVIRKELQDKNLNRLSFFTSQIDNIVEQLSILSIIVSNDPSVKKLGESDTLLNTFEQLQAQEDVVQKLGLLSVTSNWKNSLIIYLPRIKQSISNDYFSTYDDNYLRKLTNKAWVYHPIPNDQSDGYFSKVLWSPLLVNKSLVEADAVVEVRFSESNMIRMLSDYKNDGQNGNSFFYKLGYPTILDDVKNKQISDQISSIMDKQKLRKAGYQTLVFGKEQYLVSYVESKSLGWYAVDYLPLKQVLTPITKSRNLFYGAIALILLFGLMASVLLYGQVQKPIRLLLKGVQKIQTGSYSHRLHFRPRNEFDFLFIKFNEMTEEIQRLLEKVYQENIRFREVKLKHLQSQINPHFLSNSLFFVKNMIAIDDKQAATTMILNLAEYFRYITKLEHTLTTLQEEIKLIESYLTIQNLRIQRFHYEVDIPDSMSNLQIPRLMIQPIVENTILHGIEKYEIYGIIRITGEESEEEYRIIIDDNGGGITDELLRELELKVSKPLDQEEGCGLWNVHQRLYYQYDQHSGLKFEFSPLAGLRVIVHWRKHME
jgi:two-component system sensor histidine kinase YesM